MGNAARKARKRAGEKFEHPEKVPTPEHRRVKARRAQEKRISEAANKMMGALAGRTSQLWEQTMKDKR